MAILQTLARPYAKAIFACCDDGVSKQQWLEFLQAVVPVNSKALVISLQDVLSELQYNFLTILSEAKRLNLLAEIAKLFQELCLAANNSVAATLVTASTIDNAMQAKFQKQLTAIFNKTTILTCAVNPQLLGGFIVTCGSDIIDGSLRTALENCGKSISSKGIN